MGKFKVFLFIYLLYKNSNKGVLIDKSLWVFLKHSNEFVHNSHLSFSVNKWRLLIESFLFVVWKTKQQRVWKMFWLSDIEKPDENNRNFYT